MFNIRNLFGLVLVILVFGVPAQACIMRDGVPSSEYEAFGLDPMFDSVGWLVGQKESGGWGFVGSAVLIAPDWVLTAGHNITRLDDSGFLDMMFSLDPDIYGGDLPEYIDSDATYVYPGYSGTSTPGTGSDIGLIHLSTPIYDVEPAVLYSGEDERGTLMCMAGFGDPGTGSGGLGEFDGIKRAGSNVAAEFGGDHVDLPHEKWTVKTDCSISGLLV